MRRIFDYAVYEVYILMRNNYCFETMPAYNLTCINHHNIMQLLSTNNCTTSSTIPRGY